MKICITNMGFGLGGVERVAIQIANSLCDKGEDVTLIDFSGKYDFFYHVEDKVKIPKDIKPRTFSRKLIKRAFYFKYRLNKNPISILDIYKEQTFDLINHLQKNSYDVLILCQNTLTAVIPTIKEYIPELKIVAWQHNSYDVYMENYCKEFIIDYKKGLELADLVVCLTNADLTNFKKINSNSKKIYNPLTLNNPKLSKLDNKNIIFVGRLSMEQKGLDYLIKIAKLINSEWKIIVVGKGDDEKSFRTLIKNQHLEKKFILKGPLQHDELRNLYAEGSIFISTSRWEGFGLVITEAMASGLPIVSFDNFGPKEILREGEFGVLIKKYNIEEFKYYINELVSDISKRKELQYKSLIRAKDFAIDNIINEWLEHLYSI
ncbi:glycosyltransferase [Priestia flexa]|uniref:glycosyltransferase n=1 Tax=Priestia flexa TaxID=86664 RepID=UPI00240D7A14|nr:glycosyltransferase [Priestia flexa]WEZ07910.1 glycosyltransferase [Priestia flexa]